MKHHNRGLRKLCGCSRRNWSKCVHPWHFNFKPKGGRAYRFSLDAEIGRHIKTKEEAETEADRIRIAIRDGTFVRAADRPKAAAASDVLTIEKLGDTYFTKYMNRKTRRAALAE